MLVSEAFLLYETEKLLDKAPKTRKNYQAALNSFTGACGDIDVTLVSHVAIVQWKKQSQYKGHAPSYIATNLSRFRQVFGYLKKHGYNVLDKTNIERPSVPPTDPTYLSRQEVVDLLAVIESPRDKAIFWLLFSSGARISELLQLNRDSIVDGKAHIIGKGEKPGILRFDSNALRVLDDYLQTRSDSLRPLFVSSQNRRITVSRVQQLAHKYEDMAGLTKNFTPHIARHTFASELKLNGGDIFDIKEQLRHKRISSTMIYVHIGDEKRDRDYERLHTPLPIR